MNLAMRKLALLAQEMDRVEETRRIEGWVSSPIDNKLRDKIQDLMNKVNRI